MKLHKNIKAHLSNKVINTILLSSLLASGSHQVIAGEMTAKITLTSDYVFRGISQTNGDPAHELYGHYQFDSGWLIGGYISPVDFGTGYPAKTEYDIAVGHAGKINDYSWDCRLIKFIYQNQNELNSQELRLNGQWKMLGVTYGYSNSWSGSDVPSHYFQLSFSGNITNSLNYYAHVGRSMYNTHAIFVDYTNYEIGITKQYGKFNVNLSGTSTTHNIYGENGDDRAIITLNYLI